MGTQVFETEFDVGSDFLFPSPRILYGIARLLDLGAQLDSYSESLTPAEADALALFSDWRMVGRDFQAAINHHVQNRDDAEMAIR